MPVIPGFDPTQQAPAYTRVRAGDPGTSHEAAAAISDKLRMLQQRVLTLFDQQGEMTHHQLIAVYRAQYGRTPESTIRTRCAELVDKGLIRDTGRTALVGKRHAVIWQRV